MSTATEMPTSVSTQHVPAEMTTAEFFRLIDSGVFDPHRRFYLWRGRLCEAMGKSPEHVGLANAFMLAIMRRLPENWFISAENPLALSEREAPLPDFTVVHGDPRASRRENRHIEAREVGLVVEVSVTSLPRDMGDRRSAYALAMTTGAYVVIDSKEQCLWVHQEPGPDPNDTGRGAWGKLERVGPGEAVRLSLGEQVLAPIPWEDILG